MNLETLKALLDIPNRDILFTEILSKLEKVKSLDYTNYQIYETSERMIPIIRIAKP